MAFASGYHQLSTNPIVKSILICFLSIGKTVRWFFVHTLMTSKLDFTMRKNEISSTMHTVCSIHCTVDCDEVYSSVQVSMVRFIQLNLVFRVTVTELL